MKEMYLAFLVDDDPDDHKFFKMAVSRLAVPVRCEFAYGGVEAIEMLKNISYFNPDIIFLDINMPIMNGMECLRTMRKMEKLVNTPIYMYSTSADIYITTSCLTLGATGTIKKVPSVKLLKEMLGEIFLKQKVNS
ncbi:MAG: response regulator [Bacteroidetes bacterium]|nr:MAG: response regulator [Bacteroidota bacterium]